jgi:hypothetical protein
MVTLKIIGLVNGVPTKFDGKYLVEYDPKPRLDDVGEYYIHLVATDKPEEARQFAGAAEAMEAYLSYHALRPDGKPDRPLTAYTVEVE